MGKLSIIQFGYQFKIWILRTIRGVESGARWYLRRTPVLSMAFRRAIPPYILVILQWRPSDNLPCCAGESMPATVSNKPIRQVISSKIVVREWPMLFNLPKLLTTFLFSTGFPFYSVFLQVSIVCLGSSDWWGVNRCLHAFSWGLFLIIIIIIITNGTIALGYLLWSAI